MFVISDAEATAIRIAYDGAAARAPPKPSSAVETATQRSALTTRCTVPLPTPTMLATFSMP
jgi:hypothetical protein